MRYIVLITVFFLSCNGITEPKKTSFDNNDISFTCLDGWSITEEDNLDGQGYCFSIEKSGFDSSGVMTLNYFIEPFRVYSNSCRKERILEYSIYPI